MCSLPFQVATLVTLYNYLEDTESAAHVLNDAVDRLYNRNRSTSNDSRALAYLIQQNIIYQEKQGHGQRVTEMLEILHKSVSSLLTRPIETVHRLDSIRTIRIRSRN
jgi:hypothetical protein